MKTFDNGNQISPELNIKMKKNLLWIFIFAVIMIFAGLTSGYIVSQGGNFWVNIKMPSSFTISTIAIFISSGFLFLANWAVKQDKAPIVKLSLGLAFVFGVVFGVYQFKGWAQLVDNGNALSSSIMNTRGRYGKYFTLIYEGKEVIYDNDRYLVKNEEVSEDIMAALQAFSSQLQDGAKSETRSYNLSDYGTTFSLRYSNKLVTYTNNKLQVEGVNLSEIQHDRLWHFANNIVTGRGDFIMKGKYGEDFVIYYKGEELEYKNRQFYMKGLPLSPIDVDKLATQDNTASAYIYAFSGVHFLHYIGAIIALLVMFIKGLQMKYSSGDYLGITLGSIYWHFLGILWLYLYAFLIFIH